MYVLTYVAKAVTLFLLQLYPSCALRYEFGCSEPFIICGPEMMKNVRIRNNRFFYEMHGTSKKIQSGLIQGRFHLPVDNLCGDIPLLLTRMDSKSIGLQCFKCALKKRKKFCSCSTYERSFVSVRKFEINPRDTKKLSFTGWSL